MADLFPALLLETWEQGLPEPGYKRALMLLALACPEKSTEECRLLPIGRRDAWLLSLRERLFGSGMDNLASCPSCAQQLEFSCTVADLYPQAESDPDELLTLTRDELVVSFRLPNSADVMTVVEEEEREEGDIERALLERCITEVRQGTDLVPVSALDETVLAAVVEAMDQADPLGNMQLAMTCPACSHNWLSPFDIVSYLWSELDAWAGRTLREVHVLALAYGWSEREILTMSPWRRHYYLDLVLQ